MEKFASSLNSLRDEILSNISSMESPKTNLSQEMRKTLTSLRAKETGLLIRNADKNLGLTIMTTTWYHETCMKQLQDETFYEEIKQDWTPIRRKLFFQYQELANHAVVKDTYRKYLQDCLTYRQVNEEPAKFYVIPKVHKNPIKGRPIVSSTKYITTPISRVLDVVLQPLTRFYFTILKNSTQLVNELEGHTIPEGYQFFSSDVSSLYTNINLDKLQKVVEIMIPRLGLSEQMRNWTLKALDFVLQNNYLWFEDKIFRQKTGIAMGTAVAPILANLYLAHIENINNVGRHNVDPLGTLFYRRYLDDVFCLLPITTNPIRLHYTFNAFDENLELTPVLNTDKVSFLDLELFRAPGNKILIRPYAKPLNRYLYIPYSSCHTKHTLKGFIKAELIRFARNSSQESDFIQTRKSLYRHLRERGYPREFLQKAFATTAYKNREVYLATGNRRKDKLNVLILPFGPFTRKLRIQTRLHRLWDQYKSTFGMEDVKSIVAWTRNPNLGELLTTKDKFPLP